MREVKCKSVGGLSITTYVEKIGRWSMESPFILESSFIKFDLIFLSEEMKWDFLTIF